MCQSAMPSASIRQAGAASPCRVTRIAPGASQQVLLSLSSSGMMQFPSLKGLNKSSAKVAEFLIRVTGPKKEQYEYVSKRASSRGQTVTTWKMECLLLSVSPTAGTHEYCVGTVEGSEKDVDTVLGKFVEGSKWKLSKVVFDVGDVAYISTPVKFRSSWARAMFKRQQALTR